MRFSGRRRFSIQFSTFADLNWTRTIFVGAMILAVVLYTATVLCQIASGLPKLQSSQVSKILFSSNFENVHFVCINIGLLIANYNSAGCEPTTSSSPIACIRYIRCIYCNWPRSLASATIISRT